MQTITFEVVEATGTEAKLGDIRFAYQADQAPIGDASAFALVYKAFRVDTAGNELSDDREWIVKQSLSKDENDRFKDEYDLLQKLATKTREVTSGIAYTPEQVYLVKDDTGVQSLVMPFYPDILQDKTRDRYVDGWQADAERQTLDDVINYIDRKSVV
jgi:hypothetical protein